MRDESPPGRTRFEALYAAEGRRVLAYALRRTSQPADAADVLAEVFLVAWRRLDAVPPGDEARLWLYGVARRVLANQRRGARRRDRLGQRLAAVLPDQVVAGPDPGDGRADTDDVRAALAQLGDADREVIQLTTWEGLNAAQVAAVLGVPAATVRTRLHRARRRLRLSLADTDHRAEGEGRGGGASAPAGDAGGEHPAPSGHPPGGERPLVRDHEDHR